MVFRNSRASFKVSLQAIVNWVTSSRSEREGSSKMQNSCIIGTGIDTLLTSSIVESSYGSNIAGGVERGGALRGEAISVDGGTQIFSHEQ